MKCEITPIPLPLPFRLGSVNCYLIATESGSILIDTGGKNSRKVLLSKLESAGCNPGQLRLIILTHGDFDHTGSAAYLRATYETQIAMHPDDAGMAEHGDMFFNRQRFNALLGKLAPIFSGFSKAERFTPDILLKDGGDLSAYGLDASVISIPGHSKGSIAILNADGDLFCGDLLENTKEPALGSIMDDPVAAHLSLQALSALEVGTVYPGHGQPFPMHLFATAKT